MRSCITFLMVMGSFYMLGCAKASNPYADRYKKGAVNSQQSVQRSDQPTGSGDSKPGPNEPKQVDVESLDEKDLGLAELVCANGGPLSSVQEEFDQLCESGSPTTVLATALASPYTGSGTPSIQSIKSDDVNGISHISGVTSFKIKAPISELLKKRERLATMSVEAVDAMLERNKIGDIPADEEFDLPGTITSDKLQVTVRQILTVTITDTSVSETKAKTLQPGKAVALITKLKQGDPANSQMGSGFSADPANLRSNLLAIWLADGEETMVLASFYQEITNQSQHQTVLQTASQMGVAINKKTYELLSAP